MNTQHSARAIASVAVIGMLLAALAGRAQVTGTVAGTIRDSAGTPIQGATIRLEGTTQGAKSRVDGTYRITGVRAGEYQLSITCIGYAKVSANTLVRVGETSVVDVMMAPGVFNVGHVAVRASGERNLRTTKQGSIAILRSGFTEGFGSGGTPYYPTVSPVAESLDTPYHGDSTGRGNAMTAVAEHPLSTFSLDVDAASYTFIRDAIGKQTAPPAAAVRIEEMLNYFTYDYPRPTDGEPFRVTTEVAPTPWNAATQLVRIGVQASSIAERDLPPSNLVFLVDVSGSMSGPKGLGLVQQALARLAANLRPQDQIALVTYAGRSSIDMLPTSGTYRDSILRAINGLAADGSTNGSGGIEAAYRLAEQMFNPRANNRVVLATDGDFNVGVTSPKDLIKLIERKRATGIFLTAIGVGMGREQDALIEQIADHGNGAYYYIDDSTEAARLFGNNFAAAMYTVAKDVKVQVEFNPETVESYRLIGYDNRQLADSDFANDRKDAGDIGSGHSVTALYEITLRKRSPASISAPHLSDADLRYHGRINSNEPRYASELLDIRLRYKNPDSDQSALVESPVAATITELEHTSADFRFAAAVTQFGLLLRANGHHETIDLGAVLQLAEGAIAGHDDRAAFCELLRRYRTLPATPR